MSQECTNLGLLNFVWWCVIFVGQQYEFFFCHPSGAYSFEVGLMVLGDISFWRVLLMHYVTVNRNCPGPSVRTLPYYDVGHTGFGSYFFFVTGISHAI